MFKIGKRVTVQLGYADKLIAVVSGQISSAVPHFPGVRLADHRDQRHRRDAETQGQQAAPGRADLLPQQGRLGDRPEVAQRQPDNMQVSVPDKTGPRHQLVVQKNQDDASFLMERAKRIDYDCYVTSDAVAGTQTLHFVPPPDGRNGGAGPRVPAGVRAGAGR